MVFQIGIGIAIAISISDEDRDRDCNLDFGDRGHALYVSFNKLVKVQQFPHLILFIACVHLGLELAISFLED